mmetsp:Transcript_17282/g.27594  ORF Transcript_17282/g.27594 Transcript_17282/m.27594 type:complete len:164 (-) Transcript_17282:1050-1541(-)
MPSRRDIPIWLGGGRTALDWILSLEERRGGAGEEKEDGWDSVVVEHRRALLVLSLLFLLLLLLLLSVYGEEHSLPRRLYLNLEKSTSDPICSMTAAALFFKEPIHSVLAMLEGAWKKNVLVVVMRQNAFGFFIFPAPSATSHKTIGMLPALLSPGFGGPVLLK